MSSYEKPGLSVTDCPGAVTLIQKLILSRDREFSGSLL